MSIFNIFKRKQKKPTPERAMTKYRIHRYRDSNTWRSALQFELDKDDWRYVVEDRFGLQHHLKEHSPKTLGFGGYGLMVEYTCVESKLNNFVSNWPYIDDYYSHLQSLWRQNQEEKKAENEIYSKEPYKVLS